VDFQQPSAVHKYTASFFSFLFLFLYNGRVLFYQKDWPENPWSGICLSLPKVDEIVTMSGVKCVPKTRETVVMSARAHILMLR
jgi:hypothetical protein